MALKGSEIPYTIVFAGEHRYVREHLDIEPISANEYYAAVETARKCDCGGKLSFDDTGALPENAGSARIKRRRSDRVLRLTYRCPEVTTHKGGIGG